MRKDSSHLERHRDIGWELRFAGDTCAGTMNGCFVFKIDDELNPGRHAVVKVIASNGTFGDIDEGWEHVSVSIANRKRCPTWREMCIVKDLFWEPEEAVIQLHPPRSQYVSHHPYCLHLWRPTKADLPLPPMWMVGPEATGPRLVQKAGGPAQ